MIEWGGPNSRYGKLNIILGKGAYKVVWKAIDREDGIEVAWNSCQASNRNEFADLADEVEILKKVRHPNIITFQDSWYNQSTGEFIFITELMTSGTLREYGRRLVKPSNKIIRRWSRQIIRGLQYLHLQSPPVIHRDIKCDNIFINGSHGEVKIGDMGTAKMRGGKKYTVIGTPEFMAPEMYEEKGYSEKVDIYAFGMCLLEMFTGEYPYAECKNAAQIYKKVSQGIKPDCLKSITDPEVLSLIHCCLAPEEERWPAKRLLEHPFMLEEPEVVLLNPSSSSSSSSDPECNDTLKMQLVFKGNDKHTVKFDFNLHSDTAEHVVKEMIQEQILSRKYENLVSNEISRLLPLPAAPLVTGTNSLVVNDAAEIAAAPQQHQQQKQQQQQQNPTAQKRQQQQQNNNNYENSSEATSPLPPSKEYPNDYDIVCFVKEIAQQANRSVERAMEWAAILKGEDLECVGDLRNLEDSDWNRLNLTVFSQRVIRNGVNFSASSSSVFGSPPPPSPLLSLSDSIQYAPPGQASPNQSAGNSNNTTPLLTTIATINSSALQNNTPPPVLNGTAIVNNTEENNSEINK